MYEMNIWDYIKRTDYVGHKERAYPVAERKIYPISTVKKRPRYMREVSVTPKERGRGKWHKVSRRHVAI